MEGFFTFLAKTNQCICNDIKEEEYSQFYKGYNFAAIIVLVPAVSLFGLWSNCVNIFLYSRPQLRNSQNSYLAALALSDFLVIVNGLVVFWCDSARAYIEQLEAILRYLPLSLSAGYIAQTCSVYFTVFAAVDCYVAVCWKHLAASWCTVPRSRLVILFILISSGGYNSLRFGQFQLHNCFMPNSTEEIIEVVIRIPPLTNNSETSRKNASFEAASGIENAIMGSGTPPPILKPVATKKIPRIKGMKGQPRRRMEHRRKKSSAVAKNADKQ